MIKEYKYNITFLLIILFLNLSCNLSRYDKEDNYVIQKYPNGSIMSISVKVDSVRQDCCYFYQDKKFLGFSSYKNNQLHGFAFTFYRSGRPKDLLNWYEGDYDGDNYWYSDTKTGYPLVYRYYNGIGKLGMEISYDSSGAIISKKGKMPEDWSHELKMDN